MKCHFIKPNHSRCQSPAMKGYDYCFTHNPNTRHKHSIAASKGGALSSRRDKMELEPVVINNPNDIKTFVKQIINEFRAGKMTSSDAGTLSNLANTLIRAFELADVKGHVEIVERVIMERKSSMRGGGYNEKD